MSLETFWENINSPEFLEEKFEVVRQLCIDFTEDVKDIVEQAEELVCDGFREILLRGELEYQSSFELREQAGEMLKEARQTLHAARGIDEKSMPVFSILKDELNGMADALEKNASPLLEEVRHALEGEFELISFGSPVEMRKLQGTLSAIYELPETPSYDPPSRDEDINFLGSFPMRISNKKERKAAAVKYMKEAKAYEHALAALTKSAGEHGLLFNIDAISEDVREIIVAFDKHWREIFPLGCDIDYKPDVPEEPGKRDAKDLTTNQLKLMLIIAAGIYTAGKYAVSCGPTHDPEIYSRLAEEYIRLSGMATLLMEDREKAPFGWMGP